MAMTRRSWYRVLGCVAILGVVVCGAALLWSQPPAENSTAPIPVSPRVVRPTEPAVPATTKPLGTWERKIGPLAVTLRFDNEQMYGTIVIKTKEAEVKEAMVTFRADYSVTKDSLIYGVVTTVDMKVTGKKKVEAEELLKLGETCAAFQDQPFSMRYRVDGNELILRDLKLHVQMEGGSSDGLDGKKLAIGMGRFTRKVEETTATTVSSKKH
jgi:hypothetical protein